MSNTSESSTDLSLLSRVRDAADHDAWREFVTRYGRRIFGWCRGWGLQEGDAEDVTQNVLLQLAKQMRNFRYDPTGRFRSWLRLVTYRAWCDFLEQMHEPSAPLSNSAILDQLDNQNAREALLAALEEECQQELVEIAMRLAEKRMDSKTWRAFHMTTYGELSAQQVAEELQMSTASVYQAKSRAQKLIREELENLEARE